MRTMLRWLPLMAFLLWSVSAMADDVSLLQLHNICKDEDQPGRLACSGFLTGFLVGLKMGTQTSKEGKPICFPSNFSGEQMKLILDNIISDGPQWSSLPAAPALTFALQATLPCWAPPLPTPRPQQRPSTPPKERKRLPVAAWLLRGKLD
jgi:hypothetical protein